MGVNLSLLWIETVRKRQFVYQSGVDLVLNDLLHLCVRSMFTTLMQHLRIR